MRDRIVVATVAMFIVACSVAALPHPSPGSPQSDENPYPEVNPCASGLSEVTGTIKVCTLMRIGSDVVVMTHPLRAMVWIQISATGPTAHVSDTLNGVAWVQDSEGIGLTPRDDWFVAIQSWNLPPGVELLPPTRYEGARPGEARTFVFDCLSGRCDRPAPSPTPTITSRPPNATREPSPTSTPDLTGTATVTVSATVPATATMTGTNTPTVGPSPTLLPTMTVSPTASTTTVTPALTATVTVSATASSAPTSSVMPTVTNGPSPLPTLPGSPTVTATLISTLSPSVTAPSTATRRPQDTATSSATPDGSFRIFMPVARKPAGVSHRR